MEGMEPCACVGKADFSVLCLLPVFKGRCGDSIVVWAAGLTIVHTAMRIILTRKCRSIGYCDMCSVLRA
jgi:hypothetical protein